MAIFTGISDILLFIILFVLLYCTNDSIIAQIILTILSVFSLQLFVSTMAGTQNDALFALFFTALISFGLGNILMWIHVYTKKDDNNNPRI